MKRFTILLIFLSALLALNSCDKEKEGDGTLIIEFKGKHNGSNFAYNTTYKNAFDYNYQLTLVNFYLSKIRLIETDGSEYDGLQTAFIDFSTTHSQIQEPGKQISFTVPEGDYTGIRFDFGVEETLNHSDPAQYDTDHPLSIYNGNHWNWNPGYIFLKLEGFVDSVANGDEHLSRSFEYHCGADEFYAEIPTLSKNFSIEKDGSYTFKVDVNVEKFFTNPGNNIDLYNDPTTHTSGNFALADSISRNFTTSFSVGN